jgi:hypothetical protein
MNKNLKILAQNIKGLTYDETMELTRYLAEFVGDIPHEELDEWVFASAINGWADFQIKIGDARAREQGEG